MNKAIPLILLIFLLGAKTGYSQTVVSQNQKTQWFTDARLGMFIHFGLYSIPAGVWEGKIMGRNMYAEWIQKQGNWPNGIPDNESFMGLSSTRSSLGNVKIVTFETLG